MQEAENTRVVREAYAAFGRADVQAVLDTMDDEIVRITHFQEFMDSAAINAAFEAVATSV